MTKELYVKDIIGLTRPQVIYQDDGDISDEDWKHRFLKDINYINNLYPIESITVVSHDRIIIYFKNNLMNEVEKVGIPILLGVAYNDFEWQQNTCNLFWD